MPRELSEDLPLELPDDEEDELPDEPEDEPEDEREDDLDDEPEAAAATAVIMGRAMAPEEPLEVRVDRPFLFLIRDIETGTVLFVGRVVDAAA